jgi:hypothetical protein
MKNFNLKDLVIVILVVVLIVLKILNDVEHDNVIDREKKIKNYEDSISTLVIDLNILKVNYDTLELKLIQSTNELTIKTKEIETLKNKQNEKLIFVMGMSNDESFNFFSNFLSKRNNYR